MSSASRSNAISDPEVVKAKIQSRTAKIGVILPGVALHLVEPAGRFNLPVRGRAGAGLHLWIGDAYRRRKPATDIVFMDASSTFTWHWIS